jgi:hypothetical protein
VLRTTDSLNDYLKNYSWTETDIVVARSVHYQEIAKGVHLLTTGPTTFLTRRFGLSDPSVLLEVRSDNTEHELHVARPCPSTYRELAEELISFLSTGKKPPPVVKTPTLKWPPVDELEKSRSALVQTTSGHPVAMRFGLPAHPNIPQNKSVGALALALPTISNLPEWFQAFLTDIHSVDAERVPQAPARLSDPSVWFTPEEVALQERITEISSEIERLETEQAQVQSDLREESRRADTEMRRAVWSDGDDLVEVASVMLADIGFMVENMDAGLQPNDPKREDLRLSIRSKPGWEAIVEVKGYTSGVRTNDARQIREHRDRYIAEKGHPPDLTLWLTNPFRQKDPSSRPVPDKNVGDAAENIGATHILSTDLYLQWSRVKRDECASEDLVRQLVGADPGLWHPPTQPPSA